MRRVAIALVVVVALTATAFADKRKAEKLFSLAERHYRQQNFLVAAQHFELAYKEFPAPEIAFSAAQAFRRQYRVDTTHTEYVDKAIHYYEIYLAARKTGGRVGDAADSLEDMVRERARIGGKKTGEDTLENKTMLGVTVFFADEQEAATKMREVEETKAAETATKVTVTIDGKAHAPDMLHPVEPGEHTIRAEAEGYKPAERRVKVIPNSQLPEELTLDPLPAQLTVETEAGATIIVDGRGAGEAPLAKPISLPAGSHVITVINTGRRAAAREVVVKRAEQASVKISLQPTLRRKAVPWVFVTSGIALGIAGLSGASALYFDGVAVDKRKALLDMGNQSQDTLDDYETARIRRNRARTGMYVMGGTAVAIAVTAVWLYYFDSPSAAGVTVVPVAGESAAGAAISGRF